MIKMQQDIKHAPKVKTDSEKIGYRKRERKIYGPPEMPVNLAPGPATVEMPVWWKSVETGG
jgi:hypothetical protein